MEGAVHRSLADVAASQVDDPQGARPALQLAELLAIGRVLVIQGQVVAGGRAVRGGVTTRLADLVKSRAAAGEVREDQDALELESVLDKKLDLFQLEQQILGQSFRERHVLAVLVLESPFVVLQG